MIVVLDDKKTVGEAYVSCFDREGVAAVSFSIAEFQEWFEAANGEDIRAVEGFLIGEEGDRRSLPQFIRVKSAAPVIAVNRGRSLAETLELFAAGVDDVVSKPIHVREILTRARVIRRRHRADQDGVSVSGIKVFLDGRDPIVGDGVLPLPRRERRILEYLVASRNVRVTKTQIFNRVYGLFNEDIDENVVESHISRLRKRLRQRLGRDPIDSQRYLGYRLIDLGADSAVVLETASASFGQGLSASLSDGGITLQEGSDGSLRHLNDEHRGFVCAG